MVCRSRVLAVLGIVCLAVLVAVLSWPPPAHAQQVDFSKVEIRTTKLADNFYTLEGQGGTVSVLTGPDGVLLVDSQFAPLTDKLLAAIRAVSDKPVRFLINTHLHGDHTGGNENFAKAGALLFSRDQLRARLASPGPAPDGTPGKPAPAMGR
jgi:cyclase